MRRLRVLLDADVLVDAQVRDLFLTSAEQGLIDYCWTDTILGELHRVLVGDMGRPAKAATRLVGAIRGAFPDGEIVGYQPIPTADPGDQHVLGAAVGGECDLLVTNNRRDFPSDEECTRWDLEVVRPDDGLVALVEQVGASRLAEVFTRVTQQLRSPPIEAVEQLHRLERTAPSATITIGNALGFDAYCELAEQVAASRRADSPGRAVAELIDRVRDGDFPGGAQLCTARALASLGATEADRRRELVRILGPALQDPERWGLASRARLLGVDREVVKLIAREGTPVIHEPTFVRAIVFVVTMDGDCWHVDELDIPDPALKSPEV